MMEKMTVLAVHLVQNAAAPPIALFQRREDAELFIRAWEGTNDRARDGGLFMLVREIELP